MIRCRPAGRKPAGPYGRGRPWGAFDQASRIAGRASGMQGEIRRTRQPREEAIVAENKQAAVDELADFDATARPRAALGARR
jgi:hypothetical protein